MTAAGRLAAWLEAADSRRFLLFLFVPLFSIYLVKPSPFCVFDEVDAPLDDANIGRFLNMLDRFKDHTQFIVITHNRKTMEIASRLYGVTMEEPGVSKVIALQMN